MALCEIFGDSSVARILDHLAKYEHRDYSLTELARDCGISYRTMQRIFPILVQKQLVRETRRIGKATMYSINLEHPHIGELHRLMIKEEKPPEEKSHHVAYS